MRRFAVTLPVLLVVLLVFASAAATQPAPKVARIGMLCTPLCNLSPNNAFVDELRKLGWVEGATITIERKDPDYRRDRLPALAADLVRSKPNLIVAFGTFETCRQYLKMSAHRGKTGSDRRAVRTRRLTRCGS